MLLADAVEVIRAFFLKGFGVVIEQQHQLHRAVADDAVTVDQFLVAVAQERADVWESVLQMKENRATRDEPALRVVVFRVPYTCPTGAHFAFLAVFPLRKINNLHVFSGPRGFNFPLQHQLSIGLVRIPASFPGAS